MVSPTVRRVGIGIAIFILAAASFGTVTEDVVNHEALTRFDNRVLEALHQRTTPVGVAIFTLISGLGSPLVMTMLALGGVIALAWRREWIVLGGWVGAFGGATLIGYWLKLTIHRPRPSYATTLMHDVTWSFPSGHAMGSLVGYGMLAYVLCSLATRNHRKRLWIVAGAAILILAIGVSRLYLGVHYFSDVVGGYAAGVIWLFICVAAVEFARRRHRIAQRLNPTGTQV